LILTSWDVQAGENVVPEISKEANLPLFFSGGAPWKDPILSWSLSIKLRQDYVFHIMGVPQKNAYLVKLQKSWQIVL